MWEIEVRSERQRLRKVLQLIAEFDEFMNDDLNTAKAIGEYV
jgi:hypothetical protein